MIDNRGGSTSKAAPKPKAVPKPKATPKPKAAPKPKPKAKAKPRAVVSHRGVAKPKPKAKPSILGKYLSGMKARSAQGLGKGKKPVPVATATFKRLHPKPFDGLPDKAKAGAPKAKASKAGPTSVSASDHRIAQKSPNVKTLPDGAKKTPDYHRPSADKPKPKPKPKAKPRPQARRRKAVVAKRAVAPKKVVAVKKVAPKKVEKVDGAWQGGPSAGSGTGPRIINDHTVDEKDGLNGKPKGRVKKKGRPVGDAPALERKGGAGKHKPAEKPSEEHVGTGGPTVEPGRETEAEKRARLYRERASKAKLRKRSN